MHSQLMYDSSGGGEDIRKFTTVTLAWWHTFKHVTNKIWMEMHHTVFGPMMLELYPADKCYRKPQSLLSAVVHFQYMRYAYPAIREDLHGLLRDEALVDKPHILQRARNLIFMFEFAIPSVHELGCVLRLVWTQLILILTIIMSSFDTEMRWHDVHRRVAYLHGSGVCHMPS